MPEVVTTKLVGEVEFRGAEKSGRNLDNLAKTAEKTEKVTDDLTEKTQQYTKAAKEQGKGALTASSALGKTTKAVAGLAAAYVSLDAVAGLANVVRDTVTLSRLAGESIQDFQQLSASFATVNFQADKTSDILKDVNDKVGDFVLTGGGEFKDIWEQILKPAGRTREELAKMTSSQVLIALAEDMEKLGFNTQETTFALEAIANDASALAPVLQDLADALRDTADNPIAKALTLTPDEAAALTLAQENLGKLVANWELLKIKVGGGLAELLLPAEEINPEQALADITAEIDNLQRELGEIESGETLFDRILGKTERPGALRKAIAERIPTEQRLTRIVEERAAAEAKAAQEQAERERVAQERRAKAAAAEAEAAAKKEAAELARFDRLMMRQDEAERRIREQQEQDAKRRLELEERAQDELTVIAIQGAQARAELLQQQAEAEGGTPEQRLGAVVAQKEAELLEIERLEIQQFERIAELREQNLISAQEAADAEVQIWNSAVDRRLAVEARAAKESKVRLSDLTKTQQTFVTSLSSSTAQSLVGLVKQTTTIEEALLNIIGSTAEAILQQIIQTYIQRLLIEKVFGAKAAASKTAEAQGAVAMAGLNTFASISAIPVVGPFIAPAAATAAIAAATPFAAAVSAGYVAATAAREQGGMVTGGASYLVGERGPELFTPDRSGAIVSNRDMLRDKGSVQSVPEVVIINQTPTEIEEADAEVDEEGRIIILIRETVSRDLNDPNSDISKSNQRNFNLQRVR